MSPIAVNIILYTSIAAFVLCVIGGLLILFERWEPKHSGTRRWLVGGVLTSIVGGVVANSNAMFQPPDNSIERAENDVQPGPKDDTAPLDQPSKSDTEKMSLVDVDLNQQDNAGLDPADPLPLDNPAKSWSPRIVAWQSENLPERPNLPAPPDKNFPLCAEEMKTQDITEITKADARTCFRLLDQFNSSVLLPYQVRYHPYTDRVEQAAINQPDAELLDFLQLEYFNLTDSEGADFLRFNAISNKFDGDRRWVQRLK